MTTISNVPVHAVAFVVGALLTSAASAQDAGSASPDFALERITSDEVSARLADLRVELVAFSAEVDAFTEGREPTSGLLRDECPQDQVLRLTEDGAGALELLSRSPTPQLVTLQGEVDSAVSGLVAGAEAASSNEAADILAEKADALRRQLVGANDIVRIAQGRDALLAALAHKTRDILVACLEVDAPTEVHALLPGIGDLVSPDVEPRNAAVAAAPTAVVPLRVTCNGASTVRHGLERRGDVTPICRGGNSHVIEADASRATLVVDCGDTETGCGFRVDLDGGVFDRDPRAGRDSDRRPSFIEWFIGTGADTETDVGLDEVVTDFVRRSDGRAVSGTLAPDSRLRVDITRDAPATVVSAGIVAPAPKASYFPGERITVADARLMLKTYHTVLADHADEVDEMTRDGVSLSGLIGDRCAADQIERLIADGRSARRLLTDSPVPEIVDFASGIRGGVTFLASRSASAPSPEGAAIYRWKREALEDQIVFVEDLEDRARQADGLLAAFATKTRNVLVGCLEVAPAEIDALLTEGS